MDIFSLSSTVHYSHTPPSFSTSTLAGKHHVAATTTTTTSPASFILASNSSEDSAHDSTTSLRRPTTQKPLKASTSNSSQLLHHLVILSVISYGCPANSHLRPPLSSPPPAPLLSHPLQETPEENEVEDEVLENSEENEKEVEFREQGKIFVGNLPLWIKKKEVAEFFRQFGPIKNVILIKGHDDLERNMGFGFVIYSGHTAEKAAMKAVEFDGIEFHGRVLTVKLDNGKRMKGKRAERARWVEGEGEDGESYKSKWHEEREGSRREFRRVLESQPESWQMVVQAFERIKKVKFCFFRHDICL
ncbi:UNVERIFIED_CONTAM: Pentatricopeptide repeat-containing protein, chloroplastic [Sesamum latifolium]|uniref:Pentatricopeptide repeat-containing protein, chloroplastic n=1 Tax=Sesamum latifolium TaxID=2727402 RepID=A0AAW2TAC2_9LAMI